MKRTLCTLLAILLAAGMALAEGTPFPTKTIQLITPTPSAEPAGTVFSSDELTITLPLGLEILAPDEQEGYEAALQDAFPGAARTLLAAVNPQHTSAVIIAEASAAASAPSAAREASEKILGSSDGVNEIVYGKNTASAFACAIGEQVYSLYFLSNENRLLVIGTSGISESDIRTMIAGLSF